MLSILQQHHNTPSPPHHQSPRQRGCGPRGQQQHVLRRDIWRHELNQTGPEAARLQEAAPALVQQALTQEAQLGAALRAQAQPLVPPETAENAGSSHGQASGDNANTGRGSPSTGAQSCMDTEVDGGVQKVERTRMSGGERFRSWLRPSDRSQIDTVG